MYATDFQFDGKLASSFGLIICTFDNAGDITTMRNGADVNLVTSRIPSSNIWNHVSAQYSEVLSVTFQVAKKPACDGSDQNPYFAPHEQRAINRWLNRLDNYYPFRIIQDGYEKIYFNAQINVKKIETGGKVAGFELTVTTDRPFGYYERQELVFPIEPAVGVYTYSFIDMSDDIGTEDAIIEIKCMESGELCIMNDLMQKTMLIKNCVEGEVITIDTLLRKIKSNKRDTSQLLKDFNFVWLTVGNTPDSKTNNISSNLAVDMKISYCPVCKISF